MKVILALFAVGLFGFTLAAGQKTPPPASGPVGPVGPVVADDPPPAAKAPVGGPGRRSLLLAPAPVKVPPLPGYDRWVSFDSPAGGFTIKFPAKPKSNP